MVMASLNSVRLLGNVGKDPTIKVTQRGVHIASFSLATSERWKDNSGARVEHTEWHRIVVFSDYLAQLTKHLRKGSRVYVEGTIRTRKWHDASGQDQTSKEVVVNQYHQLIILDGRPQQDNDPHDEFEEASPPSSASSSNGTGYTSSYGRSEDRRAPVSNMASDEDDIPFI